MIAAFEQSLDLGLDIAEYPDLSENSQGQCHGMPNTSKLEPRRCTLELLKD